ncbi:MAG: ABC transporter permease, partial [Acidobacteriales bacterium]|nr:ABC transporter permease [Terriglobales bacterium]
MVNYILLRLLRMIPQLFLISILAFVIIELPPGDYLTEHINRLRQSGRSVDQDELERLTKRYGLDQPAHLRYLKWMSNIIFRGDLGHSFAWNKPVSEIILSR